MLFLKLVPIIQLKVGGNAEDVSVSLYPPPPPLPILIYPASLFLVSNSVVLFHP